MNSSLTLTFTWRIWPPPDPWSWPPEWFPAPVKKLKPTMEIHSGNIPLPGKRERTRNRISHWQVYTCATIPPDNLFTPPETDGADKNNGRETGLGGIFFKCQDHDRLKAWYQQHLGMSMDTYGIGFEWRKTGDERQKGFTAWSPFKENTACFHPSIKEFMVNYRVEHLDKLLHELKAAGITISDPVETFDYGNFVPIMDPEGNKIELREANDDVYDQMIQVRTR